eukprot:scaffold25496_cov130-Isochrysis_galbana.AAC.11
MPARGAGRRQVDAQAHRPALGHLLLHKHGRCEVMLRIDRGRRRQRALHRDEASARLTGARALAPVPLAGARRRAHALGRRRRPTAPNELILS